MSSEEREPDRQGLYPDPALFTREPEPDPRAYGEMAKAQTPGERRGAIPSRRETRRPGHEDKEDEKEPGGPHLRPYLAATSNFQTQFAASVLNEPSALSFTVRNDGNYASWTCYVELYEGPPWVRAASLDNYALRGHDIIALQPGERRDVEFRWVRQRLFGRVVGRVFDPLLDPPGPFTLPQVLYADLAPLDDAADSPPPDITSWQRHYTSCYFTFARVFD